jgi:putative ABC transport system ATP-binding protein
MVGSQSGAWAPNQMTDPLIETVRLCKDYEMGGRLLRALRNISIEIRRTEFVAVMGSSGSGKTSLMNVLGLLDRPTCGTFRFDGVDVALVHPDDCARLRSERIGFVFQNFSLLARSTALENVELPLVYAGLPASKRTNQAKWALEKVGLADRANHWPGQLSGGEQQRVAIARALVNDPSVILADEPTGSLDSATGAEIMNRLCALNTEGRTIVLVTHDLGVARHAKRVISMRDGSILTDVFPARDDFVGAAETKTKKQSFC